MSPAETTYIVKRAFDNWFGISSQQSESNVTDQFFFVANGNKW